MKIHFYGGVETVTGSNFLLENKSKILIDCGLIQEGKICSLENFAPFPYKASEIKAVLITHAHLDHIGRLPKLLKENFAGYVYSTLPTKDLAKEILIDSQKIIAENCFELNKEIFYQEEDIINLMSRWRVIDYHQKFRIDDFEIEFFNSGHILGSAFIKVNNIIFSGDLGNQAKSLNKPLEDLPEVDYLVLESTYGDRFHDDLFERKNKLEKILERVIYEKRTLIIPTFALERAQELIFDISDLIDKKKIPKIRIFLASPLAVRIFKIYDKYHEFLNQNFVKGISMKHIFTRDYLEIIEKDDEPMFSASPPKIILAGSGMVMGGKILKILKKYLGNEKATILFVGYQVENSLGGKILKGEKRVLIDNEIFEVRAEILSLLSYSAHCDQNGLIDWLKPRRYDLKKVFLTHGDLKAKEDLRRKIMDELAVETLIPKRGDFYNL